MNLVLHQFKTDTRHFRWWLLACWTSFAAEAAWMNFSAQPDDEREEILIAILFWQVFNAVLLIVALVQADSLAGTGAAWLTRPLRRVHLFRAKSAFIVLLILLPKIAAESIGWMRHGYTFDLWLCAAGQSLMLSAMIVLPVAALAALTSDLPRFFLALGSTIGWVFASFVAVEMLHRAHWIQDHGAARFLRVSTDNSALTVADLALIAGALLCWVIQAKMGRARAAMACLGAGTALAPLIGVAWGFDFLKPREEKPPACHLALALTNVPRSQRISREMVVEGLPPRTVAVLQDGSVRVQYEGQKTSHNYIAIDLYQGFNARKLPAESYQRQNFYSVIRDFFPAETLWANVDGTINTAQWTALGDEFYKDATNWFSTAPPRCSLSLRVDADFFVVKKIAELPLAPARIKTLRGQWIDIGEARLAEGKLQITVKETAPLLFWDRQMQDTFTTPDASWRQLACAYVLYDKSAEDAVFARAEQGSFQSLPPLEGMSDSEFTLKFPVPALRERLLGVTPEQWLREARLCVFAPEYIGTARETIHDDHYQVVPPR